MVSSRVILLFQTLPWSWCSVVREALAVSAAHRISAGVLEFEIRPQCPRLLLSSPKAPGTWNDIIGIDIDIDSDSDSDSDGDEDSFEQ
ncbi:hypothetical protein B0H65DRAFT_447660 [Neurospora tetraspora]|uniref:Secreted protein n=1 Tax=Neurospora tetraspora TaxID=94610 RepID=A0AAE0JNP2_9PEZI|nr:hypothetical protein B0H65DRAFT_447660 [Neurospora tetraspora]